MLTKTQITALNKMLESENVKGKKLLERFIWCNTVKPKYKEGDKVIFTDRSLILSGTRVINFIGTVTKIELFSADKIILYTIEVKLSNGHTEITYAQENKISRKTTTKNLINKVADKTGSSSISI